MSREEKIKMVADALMRAQGWHVAAKMRGVPLLSAPAQSSDASRINARYAEPP